VDDSVSALGQSFVAAPSALAANTVAPATPTETEFYRLAHQINRQTLTLLTTLTSVEEASKDVAIALSELQAAASLAAGLVRTAPFAWATVNPDVSQRLQANLGTLRDKANTLWQETVKKTPRSNGRDLADSLDNSVKEDSRVLWDSLNDPNLISSIANYTKDESIDKVRRTVTMHDFNNLLARAVQTLERTDRAENLYTLGQQIFEQMDEKSSPFAVAAAERRRLLDELGYGSQATTSVIGNLPGPDTASLALMKTYSAIRLQKAGTWISPAAVDSLEGDLTAWVLDAMHLTDEMRKDVQGRIKELSAATQKRVKAQRIGRATYLANKEAEEFVAAQRVANFYKEHDSAVFDDFQRGPGFDSFISVLTIFQFALALKAYREAEQADGRQTFDMAASGAMSVAAVVSTIGRFARPGEQLVAAGIEVSAARMSLAKFGAAFESAGAAKLLGVVGGVMAIVDGTSDILKGDVVVGGVNVASGSAIIAGLLMGGAWGAATGGIGAILGLGLAGYQLYQLAEESAKPSTQRAMENLLNSLKTRPAKWNGKSVVESLGLGAQLQALADASAAAQYFVLRRNPDGGTPTRDALLAELAGAGWKSDARLLVESDDDERARIDLEQQLAQPPMPQ
jgi:hypothetical protein